jgi:hypothetical protein
MISALRCAGGFGVAALWPESLSPGKNLKSAVSDELSQGICRPSVAWFTTTRTRLKASSIGRFGSLATESTAVV